MTANRCEVPENETQTRILYRLQVQARATRQNGTGSGSKRDVYWADSGLATVEN